MGSRYYVITPSPKKSDITKDEQVAIADANLDLEKLFQATDKGTSTFGKPVDDEPPFAQPEGQKPTTSDSEGISDDDSLIFTKEEIDAGMTGMK